MTFENVFTKQTEFENFVLRKSKHWPDKDLKDYSEEEKIRLSKELVLYLYQEVAEYTNAVGNFKTHKTQKDSINVKDVKEEIADIFIFAMDLAMIFDMDAKNILEEIAHKQEKNFLKQNKGY